MQTLETVLCSTAALSPDSKTKKSMDQRTSKINLRLKNSLYTSNQATKNGTSSEKCEQSVGLASISVEAVNQQLLKNGSLSAARNSFVYGVKINGSFNLNGDNTKSTDKSKHSSSNGSVEFKPVQNNVTISNGTIRLHSNGISTGANNYHNFKCFAEIKEGNSIPANIASNDMMKNIKKVKMSTVAKRVPLINTVGNHSKLIPLTMPSQVVTVSTGSSDSSVSTVSTKTVTKPMSILEARLTNITNDVSSQQSEKIASKSIAEPSLSLPAFSSQKLCSAREQILKRTGISNDGLLECSELVPSKKMKTLRPGNQEKKSPKAVLGFERGVTRLVALESRTVTMVDVGMQVFIPGENDEEGKDTPPPAVSSVLSGATQVPITSAVPLNEKQLVVVGTKNGKKVLALSKNVLNTAGGAKTVIIGGKPTNIQMESLGCVSIGSGSIVESNTQNSAEHPVNEVRFRLSKSSANNAKDIVSKKKTNNLDHDGTSMPSLSTDTVTTPSSQSLSSITTPLQTTSSTSDVSVISQFSPALSKSIPGCSDGSSGSTQALPLERTAPEKTHIVTTDSLILPCDSPIKFCSSNFVDDVHGSNTVFLTQSCTSRSNTIQADSIVLPLMSQTNKTSPSTSPNSTIHMLPNTSSLFVLIPDSLSQGPTECDDHEVHHEMGGPDPAIMDILKRKDIASAKESPPAKRKCVDTPGSGNIEVSGQALTATSASDVSRHSREQPENNTSNHISINSKQGSHLQEHPSTPQWDSMNMRTNNVRSTNGIAREELNKFVRNAFSDFKNCLTFNKAGKLPIHVAVENNDLAAVKRQCIVLKARRVSVNIPNNKDETPLQLALYYGYSSIVKLLLQYGADATVSDPEGNSTLHLSVVHADEALESLLTSGQLNKKTINELNDEGFSALHLAAQLDKVKAINLLIKYGAQVDLTDGKSGRTALYHAAERKHYKAQKTLVDNGADMKEPTFTGSTPFTITRSDAIAQLTSGENTIAEEIDSDSLLMPSKRKSIRSKGINIDTPL